MCCTPEAILNKITLLIEFTIANSPYKAMKSGPNPKISLTNVPEEIMIFLTSAIKTTGVKNADKENPRVRKRAALV